MRNAVLSCGARGDSELERAAGGESESVRSAVVIVLSLIGMQAAD